VVFENAYTPYPLCAPARFSMMAGQLPSRIGAYDNGAEFPASIPTIHIIFVQRVTTHAWLAKCILSDPINTMALKND
jgi:arylsulfatase A-like enzyme